MCLSSTLTQHNNYMYCMFTGACVTCEDERMFTDVLAYRCWIFWCSGVTECQTEDETVISSCCDNGAPVVMGTEECDGRRQRRRRRSESEMGEGVCSAGGISDGENRWREGEGTNGLKTQLAADTQGQGDRKSERQTE